MVFESHATQIIWTTPQDIDISKTPLHMQQADTAESIPAGTLSNAHTNGANVLMADGSVRFLSQDTDANTFSELVSAQPIVSP